MKSFIQKHGESLFVVGVLIFAAVIRYLYIFDWHLPEQYIFSDMKAYHDRAQEMLEGHITKQDFFQPIGMTFFFMLAFKTGGLELLSWLQLIMSFLTVVFTWRLADKIFGKEVGYVTLLFVAGHYPFIFNSGVYLSECSFTFFISLFMYLLVLKPYPFHQSWSFLLGLIFIFGFWIKGNFVFFVPLMGGWYWWTKRNLRPLMGFTIAVALGLLGHGLVTAELIGKFQLSASNGGLNFIEGKCPAKINRDKDGYFWHSPLFTQISEGKNKYWDQSFTDSSYFMKEGLKCIAEDPVVLLESFRYIPYLLINNELWPSLDTKPEHRKTSRTYNLFFGFWALPGILIGLLLLLKKPREDQFMAIVLPIASLCFLVWLFKGEMRFRIPYDIVIIPLAIWGWWEILALIYPQLPRSKSIRILGIIVFVGVLMTFYGLTPLER